MKKITFLILMILSLSCKIIFAQNTFPSTGSAGIGTTSPNASSILEVKSTTQGILIPRMTSTQRDAIASPAAGLMIYQTSSPKGFYYYSGSAWTSVSSAYTAGTGISINGTTITNTAPDKTLLLTAGSGITVTGTYPHFTIASTGGTSSQWHTSGSNIYYNLGNVGIGTASPAYKLDVNGDINLSNASVLRMNSQKVFKDDAPNQNLFLGNNADDSLNGGYNNTAVGPLSLNKNVNGDYNTAVGANSLLSNTSGNSNTAVGEKAMYSNTTAYYNSAYGSGALYHNTSASDNTAVGLQSLYFNTASDNTAVGYKSAYSNTSGLYNTAIGDQSLYSNSTGAGNTALGYLTEYSNTTGGSNTAGGYQALYYNTIGSYNTANGALSLYKNTTGFNNTAFGTDALNANTTGAYNTAVGCTSLLDNTGSSNTAVGEKAMQNSTSGSDNSALGSGALQNNAGGNYNTAAGFQSLYNNTSSYNTAVGYQTLYHTNSGASNTAIGYQAGYNNTDGTLNTFLGTQAGYYNTTGDFNCFIGYNAGSANTTGNFNTYMGYGAGNANSEGTTNTFVGYSAGSISTGGSNTFLGYLSNPDDATLDGATGLGFESVPTASQQIMLGAPSIIELACSVALSVFSDGRYKKNINENVVGLDFINKLRPITYTLDVHSIDKKLGIDESKFPSGAIDNKEQQVSSGFIAQEVEAAANEVGYNFSGVDKPKDETKSFYALRYSDFVVPLVKAVQELSKQNGDLKSEVENLESEVESFKSQNSTLQNSTDGFAKISFDGSNDVMLLGQNVPNPFDNSTLIPFRLPANCHDASIMIIQTGTSNVVSVIPITCNETNISVDAGTLASGSYTYSLYVDGKQIATKEMILSK